MPTMAVKWKIKELLRENGITPYRLMKDTGLSQGTAYRLANNDFNSVNAEIIDAVVKALRKLTGKPVEVADLLEYQEEG